MSVAPYRPTEAVIDHAALTANIVTLARLAAPAKVCAVVKADAYGHGAVACARTAQAAGADYLAVALIEEAEELRAGGIRGPILLLTEPPPGSEAAAVAADVDVTLYDAGAIDRYAAAVAGADATGRVHLKVNTGMNRVGAAPDDIVDLAKRVVAGGLDLTGTCSHFARADEPDAAAVTAGQAALFAQTLDALADAGIDPGIRHLANSAGLIVDPAAYRYDMVRPGIGVYGIAPSDALDGATELAPVMALRSALSHVVRHPAGTSLSYGHRYTLPRAAWVGTIPIGYADGMRRGLRGRIDVLVGGRRRRIEATITMDQILVDLADDAHVRGDEVVLIGTQGDERIRVEDWAAALDTIGYEITCGIGARVPRRHIAPPTIREDHE